MNRSTTTKTGSSLESPSAFCPDEERFSILCVDDNELILNAICSILINRGWGCQRATGGEEALQFLTANHESVDLIITDNQMPCMNGLEFVRKIRATAFRGKILVHSTMLDSKERAAFEELNVDAIVTKTGNPNSLLEAINELSRDRQIKNA